MELNHMFDINTDTDTDTETNQQKCYLISILGEKIDIQIADAGTIIPALLVTIQSDMFIKAKAGRDEKMATVLRWEDFVPALERDCLVLTPFCDLAEWEEKVKVRYILS